MNKSRKKVLNSCIAILLSMSSTVSVFPIYANETESNTIDVNSINIVKSTMKEVDIEMELSSASKEVIIEEEDPLDNLSETSKDQGIDYDAIVQAAISMIGVEQDCTMLVTNALAAVGIYFHGAPEDYACLGDWTDSPIPGDIIIYSGHVAIYIGNGMAIHGGFNGTTVEYSVECANALIGYIHIQ